MNEENNYPIKYAVLELKERGGYNARYNDIIRGYIASKCYVLESHIKYLPNGDIKTFHKVIFPYSNVELFKLELQNGNLNNIGERNTIHYDAYGNPYPVSIVSELFENYEEAKEQAIEKNKKMKSNLSMEIPGPVNRPGFIEEYEELKEEFNYQLSICELFEQAVTSKTDDMNVTIDSDKNILTHLVKKRIIK